MDNKSFIEFEHSTFKVNVLLLKHRLNYKAALLKRAVIKISRRETEIFTNSQANISHQKERKPSFMKIFNDKKR